MYEMWMCLIFKFDDINVIQYAYENKAASKNYRRLPDIVTKYSNRSVFF
jgi:hypothetical protein